MEETETKETQTVMNTLTLKEAAALLKMCPEALRRKAKMGEIPGAKPGKCWCFLEGDLIVYLRQCYAPSANSRRLPLSGVTLAPSKACKELDVLLDL